MADEPRTDGRPPAAGRSVAIVVPVFDDWASFARLAQELDRVAAVHPGWSIHVLAVDDGSESDFRASALAEGSHPHLASLRVAELVCNLGHQRAIAVGIATVLQDPTHEALIVMDGDGEDDPAYVPELLAEHARNPGSVIMAERGERSEGLLFRGFYVLYKALFRAMTGRRIAFGNYGLIPCRVAEKLAYRPEIWNNLAAAIIRSRVPTRSIWTRRATRYHGRSKMNFVALILHGFSALSVHSDVLFVRLLLLFLGFALLSAAGIVVVTVIRLTTDLAIPGWTSTMVAALTLMLVQFIGLSVIGLFMVLQGRVTPTVLPKLIAPRYLRALHTVHVR